MLILAKKYYYILTFFNIYVSIINHPIHTQSVPEWR